MRASILEHSLRLANAPITIEMGLMKPAIAGVILMSGMAFACAQTITRTVTADGRVVYSDRAVPGAVAEQRTLSSAKLSDTNVLNTPHQGGDASLQACQSDLARYCASRKGKDGMECLLDHQQDVTNGCYDAMKQQMQKQQDTPVAGADSQDEPGGNSGRDGASPPPARGPLQACQADVNKLCHGVQPGGGRLVKCLLDKQSALSDACYDALSRMKNKQQGEGPGG
jgi:hypothetical protein